MKSNTAIILILSSIGLFYIFTNPQYQNVKELYTMASEYRNVLENASAIADLQNNLLVTYAALPRAEIDRINKVLPDNIDTVQLALDLDALASRYGISIKNIQTITNEEVEDAELIVLPEYENVYDKVTVSFSFISNYENFKRLLADVERSLRVMDVQAISFQTNESNLSNLYEHQISVETYWLK